MASLTPLARRHLVAAALALHVVLLSGPRVSRAEPSPATPADDATPPAAVSSVAPPMNEAAEDSTPQERAPSPSVYGTALRLAPRHLPGSPPPADPILALARLAEVAPPERVLHSALEIARRSDDRDAAAAWLTAGMIHREAKRPRLASEAFGHARDAGGPLQPWSEWFEAEQALAAGDAEAAHGRCGAALRRDPEHPHAAALQRLDAIALGRLGRASVALKAAAAWDEAHPEAPVREAVELALASWEQVHQPDDAIKRYQRLSVWHRTALAGRRADQGLADLRAQGREDAIPPADLAARKARAISMREARRKDAAWDAFRDLARDSSDDPALAAWVEREQMSFGWATRRLRDVAALLAAQYRATPSAQAAWGAYRASARAGDHAEAAAWIHRGLDAHSQQGNWRGGQDALARALMLAGDYEAAISLLDGIAARGGAIGRRAAWYAAFATVMKPEPAAARERLDKIIATDPAHRTEARYWRARLVDATDPDLARQDRAWIDANDGESWYALLLRQPSDAQGPGRPWTRDGRWPARSPAPSPPGAAPPTTTQVDTEAPQPTTESARDSDTPRLARPRPQGASQAWARASWPLGPLAAPTPTPPDPTYLDAYPSSRFHDPSYAAQVFDRFVERWRAQLPTLDAIRELTRAGLHDLSGPLMSSLFEDLQQQRRRDVLARRILSDTDQITWRQIFLHTRDHHHATRYSYALERFASDEEEARRARALALPLAHRRRVWSHGERDDLDPLLVLALMRVESVYHANAVSRVGARGAMQIMPQTGHLLADLKDDITFTAGDLHDPMLSIDYGVYYLSLLQERFGGVFPYAVASYNGGPHNVSAWLTGRLRGMPLDVWVEHIPFRETRNYVRSVSAQYARYTSIYAPPGAHVALPQRFVQDDPSVVDF